MLNIINKHDAICAMLESNYISIITQNPYQVEELALDGYNPVLSSVQNNVKIEKDYDLNDYYMEGNITFRVINDNYSGTKSESSNLNPSNVTNGCNETYTIVTIDYNYEGENGVKYV